MPPALAPVTTRSTVGKSGLSAPSLPAASPPVEQVKAAPATAADFADDPFQEGEALSQLGPYDLLGEIGA
ncbi:MAG: hypothetical protein AAFV29_06655, partial [Myxococcota bacterium]